MEGFQCLQIAVHHDCDSKNHGGALGGDKVLGSVLQVSWSGRAIGFVKMPGVLVGDLMKAVLVAEFDDKSPDVGLGDCETDHPFMARCKKIDRSKNQGRGLRLSILNFRD